MKLNILLFLSTITLLASCNGQTSNQKKNTDPFIKGDTVKELGERLFIKTGKIFIGLEVGKLEYINTMEMN